MTPRPALAISLYVGNKNVVIVGQGSRARDRAARLRAADARVIEVAAEAYHAQFCEGAFLVLAHSGDPALDRRVVADARAAGCLCYAHDQPDVSDLAMPALARRGPLSVAISTDATAPALARRLRGQVQALLDSAGQALDSLLFRMATERAGEHPDRAQRLGRLARTLHIHGRVVIDPSDGPNS